MSLARHVGELIQKEGFSLRTIRVREDDHTTPKVTLQAAFHHAPRLEGRACQGDDWVSKHQHR